MKTTYPSDPAASINAWLRHVAAESRATEQKNNPAPKPPEQEKKGLHPLFAGIINQHFPKPTK